MNFSDFCSGSNDCKNAVHAVLYLECYIIKLNTNILEAANRASAQMKIMFVSILSSKASIVSLSAPIIITCMSQKSEIKVAMIIVKRQGW